MGLASQKWFLKDPITERFLAMGGRDAEESLKKGTEAVSFSDLSAAGYVVGIDFLLIQFHSDVLKKKDENKCVWRQGAQQQKVLLGHPGVAPGRGWGLHWAGEGWA